MWVDKNCVKKYLTKLRQVCIYKCFGLFLIVTFIYDEVQYNIVEVKQKTLQNS